MIKFESEAHFEKFIIDHHKKTGELITHDESWMYLYSQMKIEGVGIPDLIAINPGETIHGGILPSLLVLELKNQPVQEKDVGQLARYMSYFERKLEGVEVRGALVVPETKYTASDSCYLMDSIGDKVDFITFSLGINGIDFSYRENFCNNRENNNAAILMLEKLNEGYGLALVSGEE